MDRSFADRGVRRPSRGPGAAAHGHRRLADGYAGCAGAGCRSSPRRRRCDRLRQGGSFDIYLLDILMPELDGIALGRMIRRGDSEVPVIYVTSSTEYALDAFGIHAVGYLPSRWTGASCSPPCSGPMASTPPASGRSSPSATASRSPWWRWRSCCTWRTERGAWSMPSATGGTSPTAAAAARSSQRVGQVAESEDFLQPHKSYFINMHYIRSYTATTWSWTTGRIFPSPGAKRRRPGGGTLCVLEEKGGGWAGEMMSHICSSFCPTASPSRSSCCTCCCFWSCATTGSCPL